MVATQSCGSSNGARYENSWKRATGSLVSIVAENLKRQGTGWCGSPLGRSIDTTIINEQEGNGLKLDQDFSERCDEPWNILNLVQRRDAHRTKRASRKLYSSKNSLQRSRYQKTQVPVLHYSDRVPSMVTPVEGFLLANTSQIINSTLNNNEMVRIARKAVELLRK